MAFKTSKKFKRGYNNTYINEGGKESTEGNKVLLKKTIT